MKDDIAVYQEPYTWGSSIVFPITTHQICYRAFHCITRAGKNKGYIIKIPGINWYSRHRKSIIEILTY